VAGARGRHGGLPGDGRPRHRPRTIAPTADGFHAVATLTLSETTRDVPIDVKVELRSDSMPAGCSFSVKPSDFGISPYRGEPGGTDRDSLLLNP
jgi:hypothetical protein